MYKSKLQELCHQKQWNLPDYATTKEGPDHNPGFKATVSLNGVVFDTKTLCKSSKEAQNTAAKLAFDHFSLAFDHSLPQPYLPFDYSSLPQPSLAFDHLSLPQPSPVPPSHGSPSASTAIGGTVQPKIEEAFQSPQVNATASGAKDDDIFRDMEHMYKNQLQNYAQKRNLILPVYSCEREGPPHASRFKCKVTIDGQTYESLEYFPTLKEAEHAAAKVALMSLSTNGVEEASPLKVVTIFDQFFVSLLECSIFRASPICVWLCFYFSFFQDDSGFYKNLLQELAQREGYSFPAYITNQSGEAHIPIFVSTVEIEGETFTGQEAKTKKLAEMIAAKVAYTTLKERNPSQSSLFLSPARQGQEVLESSSSLQSDGTADLQHNAGATAPVSLNIVNSEISSQHPAIQSRGPETITSDGGSSSSDIVYDHLQDPFPSVSPLPSDYFSYMVMDSTAKLPAGMSSLSCNRVMVHPRMLNMKFPVGSILLPVSDDNWVAVKLGSDLNHNEI